jgi:hypothetical protein
LEAAFYQLKVPQTTRVYRMYLNRSDCDAGQTTLSCCLQVSQQNPEKGRKLIIDGAGHWVQQERADEVNAALIDFLKKEAA